eukprot:PhM_4_TR9772/c0_g1_i1/m.5146
MSFSVSVPYTGGRRVRATVRSPPRGPQTTQQHFDAAPMPLRPPPPIPQQTPTSDRDVSSEALKHRAVVLALQHCERVVTPTTSRPSSPSLSVYSAATAVDPEANNHKHVSWSARSTPVSSRTSSVLGGPRREKIFSPPVEDKKRASREDESHLHHSYRDCSHHIEPGACSPSVPSPAPRYVGQHQTPSYQQQCEPHCAPSTSISRPVLFDLSTQQPTATTTAPTRPPPAPPTATLGAGENEHAKKKTSSTHDLDLTPPRTRNSPNKPSAGRPRDAHCTARLRAEVSVLMDAVAADLAEEVECAEQSRRTLASAMSRMEERLTAKLETLEHVRSETLKRTESFSERLRSLDPSNNLSTASANNDSAYADEPSRPSAWASVREELSRLRSRLEERERVNVANAEVLRDTVRDRIAELRAALEKETAAREHNLSSAVSLIESVVVGRLVKQIQGLRSDRTHRMQCLLVEETQNGRNALPRPQGPMPVKAPEEKVEAERRAATPTPAGRGKPTPKRHTQTRRTMSTSKK